MAVDPITLAAAGVGTIGSLISGNSQEKALKKRNTAARGYLSGYGYTPYQSPYESFFDQFINQYLSGDLTAGQENQLARAGKEAMSNVSTTMANRGGTIGGHLAMTQKTNQDLTDKRLGLIDQNTQAGLGLAQNRDSFNLSQWLKGQESNMRYKELMASYA